MLLLRLLAASLALTLAGCANLKPVQDFARESAGFTAYRDLTVRFRDTYQREQAYLTGPAAALGLDNDRSRRAAYRDLLEPQRSLATYLRTLAVLAGDKTFALTEEIEALGGGVAAHPELGLDAKHAEACTHLAQVAAKWLGAGRQAKAVQTLVRDGDPPLQTLLEGMLAIVEQYRRTHENERRAVLGRLEVELAYADRPEDRLLATLGKVHLQAKLREYELADRDYREAARGLRDIQEGHRQLLDRVDHLSGEDARAAIGLITRDLQVLRRNLQTAQAR